eukprot:TRINITY_DN3110_c0_g2_i1.p1 TRINITY_DN3110_c0_g2~~TRINITY_DN3110_c0_g2_i1.p1  ORF type:complete len:738 (+),score=230.95 TRINITY_DN3110_c0_g2_i1:119-2332(+)
MPAFGDLMKAAVSSVSTVVKGDEVTVTSLARDLVLATPPRPGLVPGMGRGAGELAEKIRAVAGGSSTLLIDLMSAGGDATSLHEGPVAWFAFPDTSAPPLQLLWSFVASALEHSQRPSSQTCILIDGPNEGRAALACVCYVLFARLFVDERKAINWYRSKRGRHVTFTPSQLRYMSYFLQCIGQHAKFTPPPQVSVLMRLITLRNLPAAVAQRHKVMLEVEHVRAVYAGGQAFSNRAKTSRICVFTPGEDGIIQDKEAVPPRGEVTVDVLVNAHVEDDFNLVLWTVNDFRRKEVLFSLQLHTSFLFSNEIQNGIVVSFPVAQMDGVQGLGPNFTVELDMVSERRVEPTTVDQGSMIIVQRPQPARRPLDVTAVNQPPAVPSMGGSVATTGAPPDSPVSMSASTIARIPSDELLMSDVAFAGGAGFPRQPSSTSPKAMPQSPPHVRGRRAGGGASDRHKKEAHGPGDKGPGTMYNALMKEKKARFVAPRQAGVPRVVSPATASQPQWLDVNVRTATAPVQAEPPLKWQPGVTDAARASPRGSDQSEHEITACTAAVNMLEQGLAGQEDEAAPAMQHVATSLDPRHSPTNIIGDSADVHSNAHSARRLGGGGVSFGSFSDECSAFAPRSFSNGAFSGHDDDGGALAAPVAGSPLPPAPHTPPACAADAAEPSSGSSAGGTSPMSPGESHASVKFRLSPSLTASHAGGQSTLTTTIGSRRFSHHGGASSGVFHSCYSNIE